MDLPLTSRLFGSLNFTPDISGSWQFRTNGNIDDDASLWIDLDGSGTFELTEMVGLRAGAGTFGAIATPSLEAGKTYRMAIALRDASGAGIIADLEYLRPGGSFTDVTGAAGFFKVNSGNQDAILKNSTGLMTLRGAGSYFGGTTVNAGTMLVNNTTGSGTGSGAVIVNNDAVLGGTGSLSGTVTLNNTATLAPGIPGTTETLGIGSIVFSPTGSGKFQAQINGGTVLTQHDQAVVNGVVDIRGLTLDTTGSTIGAGVPNEIILINNDGTSDVVIGTFKNLLGVNLPDGATVAVNGNNYVIRYAGGDGNDVVLRRNPVSIIANDSTASETPTDGGQFTVTLANVSAVDTVITYTVTAGTATEGALADFTLRSGVTPLTGTITITGRVHHRDDQR